jgi:hypothetical protein
MVELKKWPYIKRRISMFLIQPTKRSKERLSVVAFSIGEKNKDTKSRG